MLFRFAAILALVALSITAPITTARASDDPAAVKAKEQALIAVLKSNAPDAEKAITCKQLAIYGSKDAVPELAKLLGDERMSSWARTALEAIPGAEADEALRGSLGSLSGRVLVGAINSLGVRRAEAAVGDLVGRLQDKDTDVASAAAVALGHIGNPSAVKALREALAATTGPVRNAVAEACVVAAEKLMKSGDGKQAVAIYDQVRQADVPNQRILEATRGAILARKSDGVPLLVEQLRSTDRRLFQIGLTTARELEAAGMGRTLASLAAETTPERAALVIGALADRSDAEMSDDLLRLINTAPKPVRIAAAALTGRLGNASSVPTLLVGATNDDADIAGAAKTALVALKGDGVNAAVLKELKAASGESLLATIEVVGARRIEATEPLVKALDHQEAKVRAAALAALGATVGQPGLGVLVKHSVSPAQAGDAEAALKALREAAVRMPDREACAAEIAAAMASAKADTQNSLLETLGAVGGTKALAVVGAAAKGKDAQLQDTASRLLGGWMTADAAPVLLDLAKSAPEEKYQVRAMRGYIRIARQFVLPDAERAAMCAKALDAAGADAERKLVMVVLERYPSLDMLRVAVKAADTPALKADAARAALVIAQKLGPKAQTPEAKELLAKVGHEVVKIEIVKAEYGAGDRKKDVTEIVRKHTGALAIITLPSANYNEVFGGDPAPNTRKQLKIQYRVNGKDAEAVFAENAAIVLTGPK